MKVIFFGTPRFAAKILSFLIENQVEVVAIVTKPDKARGRSGRPVFSEVKKEALEHYPKIPIYQPKKASAFDFVEQISSYDADLFIVVAYGEIIKEDLLRTPRLSCLNVHASLLPKYRGAAPMQFALLNGEQESGITIMEMALKMDAGDIIEQKKVGISNDMNLEELEAKLCQVGCESLLKVIHDFERGVIVRTPQDHSQAIYVKKIDPSMTQINWKESAAALHNRIRAFSPKPGAWCVIENNRQFKRLKILRSRVIKGFSGSPGTTAQYDKNSWRVFCGEDTLELLEVQLEGKKRMLVEDFLCGHALPPLLSRS